MKIWSNNTVITFDKQGVTVLCLPKVSIWDKLLSATFNPPQIKK